MSADGHSQPQRLRELAPPEPPELLPLLPLMRAPYSVRGWELALAALAGVLIGWAIARRD